MVLEWRVWKKFHRSKSCILWDKVDTYRMLLIQKKSTTLLGNIKAARPCCFAAYLFIYSSDNLGPTSNEVLPTFWPLNPQTVDKYVLLIYKFHNKISFLGQSEVIDFLPYLLALKATAVLILWSKDLNFLVPKVFYICLLYPTGCKIRSDEIF